jgi:hypothetical protein
MKSRTMSLFFCALLSMVNCNAQTERTYETKLDSIEVQSPKTPETNSPEFMYFGVDKDEHCFYYTGNDKKKKIVELSQLDTIVVNHKKSYPTPTFIVVHCLMLKNDEPVKKLVRKLEDNGVKRFRAKKGPC